MMQYAKRVSLFKLQICEKLTVFSLLKARENLLVRAVCLATVA